MARSAFLQRAVNTIPRRKAYCFWQCQCRDRRKASTFAGITELSEDLNPKSYLQAPLPSELDLNLFVRMERSRNWRQKILSRSVPSSSFPTPTNLFPQSFRTKPPRYDRGPLHPIQSPPPSDPTSRAFIPGPFSLPRLQQTHTSTFAPDLLTLLYKHHPPGMLPGPSPQRLRAWDDSSPYHKNRPLRAPRGGSELRLLNRPITFRNVPTLSKICVHSFIRKANKTSAPLHVGGMVVQAITNVRCSIIRAKQSIAEYPLRKGKAMGVICELRGEDMWCFLSKLVDLVMPRIKEFKGVSEGSWDGSGNLSWGMAKEAVSLFPEIEINYDA